MALVITKDNETIFYDGYSKEVVNTDEVFSVTIYNVFTLNDIIKCEDRDNIENIMTLISNNYAICYVYSDYIRISNNGEIYRIDIKLEDKFKTHMNCNHIMECYIDKSYINIYNNNKILRYHKNKIVLEMSPPSDMKYFIGFDEEQEQSEICISYINNNDQLCSHNMDYSSYAIHYFKNFIAVYSEHYKFIHIFYNNSYFIICGLIDEVKNMVEIIGYTLFRDNNDDLWCVIEDKLQKLDSDYIPYLDNIPIKSARKC